MDHWGRIYDNNWDAHHAPHYTFKSAEIYLFPITLFFFFFLITLSCWQFVEILQWCNHFFGALPLVYLRNLVHICSC